MISKPPRYFLLMIVSEVPEGMQYPGGHEIIKEAVLDPYAAM
jgi:hypothetical protein